MLVLLIILVFTIAVTIANLFTWNSMGKSPIAGKRSHSGRFVSSSPRDSEKSTSDLSVQRSHEAPRESVGQPSPIYEVRQLTKRYVSGQSHVTALRPFDLDVFDQATAVFGPNGSGKSTLLNILGGLDWPTGGMVTFKGQRIPYEDPRESVHFRLRVAFVLQDLNLFADQTVRDNVAFALTRLGQSMHAARELAADQLHELRIDRRTFTRFPNQLSGGQRQRVAIARALLAARHGGAEVILADEPTASVESADAVRVFESLVRLAHEHDVPLIVVTHNHKLAEMADRVLYFEDGVIRQSGRLLSNLETVDETLSREERHSCQY
jgi:putative ABC transport system ATP-binding protein